MKKKKLISLYLLISLIGVLFVTMLFLAGLYLDLRINGISSSLDKIPERDKWILTNRGYDVFSNSDSLVSPSFIGVRTDDGKMVGAIYDADARDILWSKVKENIGMLFDGTAEKVKLSGEDERDNYIKNIVNEKKYLYVSFFNELPHTAVVSNFTNSESGTVTKGVFYIKYMFVIPDEAGNACVVCIDSDFNIVKVSPSAPVSYSEKLGFAYNGMRGFAEFEFVSDTYPEPVFSQSFDVDTVMLAKSADFYDFSTEDDQTRQLLKAFTFNTNLVKSFYSADRLSVSFVDDGRELDIDIKNSLLSYTGEDRGIHLSEYLKYNAKDGGYTFHEKLLGVKCFISSLDRILMGGEAYPTLVYAGSDKDGNNFFNLKYFYNGIMITEDEADMVIKISGDYITRIYMNMLFCDSGTKKKPVLPQKLALELFERDAGFTPRYNAMYFSNEATGNQELVWIERKGRDN